MRAIVGTCLAPPITSTEEYVELVNHESGGVMSKEKGYTEAARDELMSQIHRCKVLQASPEHQAEWLSETMVYLRERFPDLSEEELKDLHLIGERFCKPPIPHGSRNEALPGRKEGDAEEGERWEGEDDHDDFSDQAWLGRREDDEEERM